MKNKLSKKLVMTLLARNEEDIIEETIKFHLAQGVDFIIATDNGSTDRTRDIFLKYKEKGLLHLIDEPEHNYNQDVWVDRMIKIARDQYNADWVINVDADEFWFSNYGNLKLALPDPKKYQVVNVGAIQVDPVDHEGEKFSVPKNVSGLVSGLFKIIHTAKGYQKIKMGNHGVKMKRLNRSATSSLDIVIFHFWIRSFAQYERKVVNGVEALNKNPRFDKGIGQHIRSSYELYKQGKLRDDYESLKTKYSKDKSYIKSDNRLYDFVNNGYKSIDSISSINHSIYNAPNNCKISCFKEKIKSFFEKEKRELPTPRTPGDLEIWVKHQDNYWK